MSVRRRYPHYELAAQQLRMCREGVGGLRSWSPSTHGRHPPPFRRLCAALLLYARRPPLCALPEALLLQLLEELADALYWRADLAVDVTDGEEFAPAIPKHVAAARRAAERAEEATKQAATYQTRRLKGNGGWGGRSSGAVGR